MQRNRDNILKIKAQVNALDSSLFSHHVISNNSITDGTISIVMTASNRSKQTYFTLDTIAKSSIKNIHLVIVDDSVHDPITVKKLGTYPFSIDFIQINRANKYWHNPCVNYNIGFKFIKGSKVIIQNAEVCHIGDICAHVANQVNDGEYHVFDAAAVHNLECNEMIYNSSGTYDELVKRNELYFMWYQGRSRICNYHFCTALTKNTFDKVNEFSYDYAFGSDYDDDDFLLKVIASECTIKNIFNDEYNIMGIHLYHVRAQQSWNPNSVEANKSILDTKKRHYNDTGKYIDFIV